MHRELAKDPAENPWDEIYKREGRVFKDPFPAFGSLVSEFRKHNCQKILDVGCGNGRSVVHLAASGFNALGFDSSWWGLKTARDWSLEERLTVGLIQADMRRPFPFRGAVFDAVMATQVIHHALRATVLQTAVEIDRVLKSGGVLFVTVPTPQDPKDDHVEVEPGTFVPTTGSEKGLPHHFFKLDELSALFPGYKILDLSTRGSVVNAILAIKALMGGADECRSKSKCC